MAPPPPVLAAAAACTVTVVCAAAVPPGPVQLIVNCVVLVNAGVVAVPEVVCVPLQPPPAVQPVAFVEAHVSVAAPPEATDGGLADSVTVGTATAVTATSTLCAVDPPAPLHVKVKVVSAARGAVVALPLVARAPDQPPLAMQFVAFVDDHCRVVELLVMT
jgi:hypothetical protein